MCEDCSVDFLIGEDYGVGLTFTDGRGNEAISVLGEELPRKARLTICSYQGWGVGIHWYGRIGVSGRRFRYTKMVTEDHHFFGPGELDISGAYDQWKPREMQCLTIDLTRPLTAAEANTERFTQGVDEPIYSFLTHEAVVARAIEVFQQVFRGRWILVNEMTGTVACAKDKVNVENG